MFTFHGIAAREYLVARRYRLEMLRKAIAAASKCTVGSEAAARPFRRYLQHDPTVVHPGLKAEAFSSIADRTPNPTLICPASLGDPRKRAGLLFSAFSRVRERRQDARLLVFETRDPVHSRARSESLPVGVERLPSQSGPEALGRLYASSWLTVLPAISEAFGMVLTESLAAGTPVVADRSGAGPEIVNNPLLGRLFESDDEDDLVRAMEDGLELHKDPATREACRARAAEFDWEWTVPEWESLYSIAGDAR